MNKKTKYIPSSLTFQNLDIDSNDIMHSRIWYLFITTIINTHHVTVNSGDHIKFNTEWNSLCFFIQYKINIILYQIFDRIFIENILLLFIMCNVNRKSAYQCVISHNVLITHNIILLAFLYIIINSLLDLWQANLYSNIKHF